MKCESNEKKTQHQQINRSSSNDKSQANTSSKNQSLQDSRTPQFPFYKWEIYFHFIFISIITISCIVKYQIYVADHFQEIKPSLSRSFLTQAIEQIFNQTTYQQQQNNQIYFQPFITFNNFNNFKIITLRYSNDPQWQAYRNNIWILITLALVWRFITYLAYLSDRFIFRRNLPSTNPHNSQNNFSYINSYIFTFSIFLLLYSFRGDIILYMSIILVWWLYVELVLKIKYLKNHYSTLKDINSKLIDKVIIITFWIIMLATLYLNQKYEHFRFLSEYVEKLIPSSLQSFKNSHRAIHCSQLLNMTFLRLLSYGIDRVHQDDVDWERNQSILRQKRMVQCEQCQIKQQNARGALQNNIPLKQVLYCYKGRDHIIKRSHSLRQYLNYTFFTPLMLTGPPISYNNFYSFQSLPSPIPSFKQYGYHAFLIFSFQIFQHLLPVVDPKPQMTLLQLELFSLVHLMFIWYKFLIIWRTAKIWSQMFGVHVVDNMSRCILNNYGFEGFWRMWHRGFNHWLIRYLYIPLGGKNNILSILAVVAFVAFWHDHTINIVFWALIIALFMVPEILIKRYFRTNKKHLYKKHWFKYASGLASSIYIYFLIICNLIGFGYGAGHMPLIIEKLKSNIPDLLWTIFIITSACMLMFYKRNLQNNSRNY